jgi:uncharacterized delta-60 repeat protein
VPDGALVNQTAREQKVKAKLAVAVLVTCGALGTVFGAQAMGAPGALDRSFGEGGVVVFPRDLTGDRRASGQAMVVGPEDEIFVLQRATDCSSYPSPCRTELILQRFLPNGQLDSSFGVGGVVVLPVSLGEPDALAVSPGGEPVVAATSGGDISLVRFTAGGSLDPGFGGNGVVTRDYGGQESDPRIAIARNSDVILAADSSSPSGGHSMIVARYLPNGDLSPSFGAHTGEAGGPGWLSIPAGLTPGGLGLSSSGQIALGATQCCSAGRPVSVYESRRRATGTLLAGLTPGMPWQRVKVGGGATVKAVIALPGGKVYLVGLASGATFAAKLLADGKLERGFGHGGIVSIKAMNARSSRPALVDSAGRLVIAGKKEAPQSELGAGDLLVARRLPSGKKDRRFGNGSVVDLSSLGLARLVGTPISIGIQSTGRIVVFGESVEECVRSCPAPTRVLTRLFGGSAKPAHRRRHP